MVAAASCRALRGCGRLGLGRSRQEALVVVDAVVDVARAGVGVVAAAVAAAVVVAAAAAAAGVVDAVVVVVVVAAAAAAGVGAVAAAVDFVAHTDVAAAAVAWLLGSGSQRRAEGQARAGVSAQRRGVRLRPIPHRARRRSQRVRWGPGEAEAGTAPEAVVAGGWPIGKTRSRTGFLSAAGAPAHERDEA